MYLLNRESTMKTCVILFILTLLITSCNEGGLKEKELLISKLSSSGAIVQHTYDSITDEYVAVPIGANTEHLIMPFPSNWMLANANDENILLQSASDIKVFYPVQQVFYDYHSKAENKKFKKEAYAVEVVKDIDAIIETVLMPIADSMNVRLTYQFKPEGIKSIIKAYDSLQISSYNPKQKTVNIAATEWADDKNILGLVVIEQFVYTYETSSTWGFRLHSMEAPSKKYAAAKEIFLNSLRDIQPCYQTVFVENQRAIRRIKHNNNAQYFTRKEEIERWDRMSAEEMRTGTHDGDSFKKYISKLNLKGGNLNASILESCAMLHISKSDEWDVKWYMREEDSNTYIDSNEYLPNDSLDNKAANWKIGD